MIECRSSNGERHSEHDLELEIFRSGDEMNLMISWIESHDKPILWHGKHSIWMEGATGQPCKPPEGAAMLEALARRIKALTY